MRSVPNFVKSKVRESLLTTQRLVQISMLCCLLGSSCAPFTRVKTVSESKPHGILIISGRLGSVGIHIDGRVVKSGGRYRLAPGKHRVSYRLHIETGVRIDDDGYKYIEKGLWKYIDVCVDADEKCNMSFKVVKHIEVKFDNIAEKVEVDRSEDCECPSSSR